MARESCPVSGRIATLRLIEIEVGAYVLQVHVVGRPQQRLTLGRHDRLAPLVYDLIARLGRRHFEPKGRLAIELDRWRKLRLIIRIDAGMGAKLHKVRHTV